MFYPTVGTVKVPEIVIDSMEWLNQDKRSCFSLENYLEANIEVTLDFDDYELIDEYRETALTICFPVLVYLQDVIWGRYDPL